MAGGGTWVLQEEERNTFRALKGAYGRQKESLCAWILKARREGLQVWLQRDGEDQTAKGFLSRGM